MLQIAIVTLQVLAANPQAKQIEKMFLDYCEGEGSVDIACMQGYQAVTGGVELCKKSPARCGTPRGVGGLVMQWCTDRPDHAHCWTSAKLQRRVEECVAKGESSIECSSLKKMSETITAHCTKNPRDLGCTSDFAAKVAKADWSQVKFDWNVLAAKKAKAKPKEKLSDEALLKRVDHLVEKRTEQPPPPKPASTCEVEVLGVKPVGFGPNDSVRVFFSGISDRQGNARHDLMIAFEAGFDLPNSISFLTADDISAMLDYEKQKDLVGCDDVSCMVEIGGALGADFMVGGHFTPSGKGGIISVRVIDTSTSSPVAKVALEFPAEACATRAALRSAQALSNSTR